MLHRQFIESSSPVSIARSFDIACQQDDHDKNKRAAGITTRPQPAPKQEVVFFSVCDEKISLKPVELVVDLSASYSCGNGGLNHDDNGDDDASTTSAITWLEQDDSSFDDPHNNNHRGVATSAADFVLLKLDGAANDDQAMEDMLQDYEDKLMAALAKVDFENDSLVDGEGLFGETDSGPNFFIVFFEVVSILHTTTCISAQYLDLE